jgi:hypothetical protein
MYQLLLGEVPGIRKNGTVSQRHDASARRTPADCPSQGGGKSFQSSVFDQSLRTPTNEARSLDVAATLVMHCFMRPAFSESAQGFTAESGLLQQQSFRELSVALRQERVKRVPATRWSGR